MKRLIAITTLGLALSFSSLSFAFDHMDLYTKPIAKSEVKNEIRRGDMNRDFMNLYTSPKTADRPTLLTSDQKADNEYISVFGVRIPRNPEL